MAARGAKIIASTPHSPTSNQVAQSFGTSEVDPIAAELRMARPKTMELVCNAIKIVGQARRGASYYAIKKWIMETDPEKNSPQGKSLIKKCIIKGLEKGTIARSQYTKNSSGLNGSFVIPPPPKPTKIKKTKTEEPVDLPSTAGPSKEVESEEEEPAEENFKKPRAKVSKEKTSKAKPQAKGKATTNEDPAPTKRQAKAKAIEEPGDTEDVSVEAKGNKKEKVLKENLPPKGRKPKKQNSEPETEEDVPVNKGAKPKKKDAKAEGKQTEEYVPVNKGAKPKKDAKAEGKQTEADVAPSSKIAKATAAKGKSKAALVEKETVPVQKGGNTEKGKSKAPVVTNKTVTVLKGENLEKGRKRRLYNEKASHKDLRLDLSDSVLTPRPRRQRRRNLSDTELMME